MAGVTGRVAFVTGASQGIGRACALALAEGGAIVGLAARNEEKLAEVAKEIEAQGGQAAVFRMDVSNEDEVKAAIKAAISHFGKIEILVNNAGITRDMLLLRMKRADWDQVLQTNLTGPYLCAQVNAVAPGYIETAMTEALPAELKAKVNEAIPLGRAGSDMEVAHAVKFLASEEAAYITGHVLNVNGGMLMG